jgi:CelD/BcsL family acetyltransferase involved in cellulose biosynthesis
LTTLEDVAVASLRVHSVTSHAEFWALGAEWQALEATCETGLPFQTWEWSTSWWKHFHEDGLGVRDALRVCVVRRMSGEVVGIAPLMLTERPGFGPIRARVLQFIGADPNITELRQILCLPGLVDECYGAIRSYLGAHNTDWDWIAWEGPRSQTGSLSGLPGGLDSVEEKSAFVLTLAPTWVEFRTGLKRNIKESLRHCYNSLKRDGLTYRLETVAEPADIEAALLDFLRLHAARATHKGVLSHSDVFDSPQARAFLLEVCQRLAERGLARVFRLWVDGRLVSTRIGFEMGDTLYLYYSGWDPAYSQYSVMTTLVSEVIQQAIQGGLKYVHLSTGNDVSKTRWGADEVEYINGVQFSTRRSARVIHFVYETAMEFGKRKIARALVPAFLVRRSRRLATISPTKPDHELSVTHVLPAAGALLAVLDLLDGVRDGAVHLFAIGVG